MSRIEGQQAPEDAPSVIPMSDLITSTSGEHEQSGRACIKTKLALYVLVCVCRTGSGGKQHVTLDPEEGTSPGRTLSTASGVGAVRRTMTTSTYAGGNDEGFEDVEVQAHIR